MMRALIEGAVLGALVFALQGCERDAHSSSRPRAYDRHDGGATALVTPMQMTGGSGGTLVTGGPGGTGGSGGSGGTFGSGGTGGSGGSGGGVTGGTGGIGGMATGGSAGTRGID